MLNSFYRMHKSWCMLRHVRKAILRQGSIKSGAMAVVFVSSGTPEALYLIYFEESLFTCASK